MTESAKLLYVEDDPTLGFVTQDNLVRRGYDVVLCDNGEKGLDAFTLNNFDLIILDIMLPLLDGLSLAKEIRKKNRDIPIIFLTARSMLEDKLEGLSTGADDYLIKPFSIEELVMKIEIFLKRSKVYAGQNHQSHSNIGKFIFNSEILTLALDGDEQKLTLREAELIKYFFHNQGKLLAREEIQNSIWGSDDYFTGRSLDVFISRIRKYLKKDPDIKIENRHGIGFIFTILK